jgi:hypothetical protein
MRGGAMAFDSLSYELVVVLDAFRIRIVAMSTVRNDPWCTLLRCSHLGYPQHARRISEKFSLSTQRSSNKLTSPGEH